jgi:hypothetical protein
MLIRWHSIGRGAHRADMLGPLDLDAFQVGAGGPHALPVEGDLLVLPLGNNGAPLHFRVKRRRFDFTAAQAELHIDVELVNN